MHNNKVAGSDGSAGSWDLGILKELRFFDLVKFCSAADHFKFYDDSLRTCDNYAINTDLQNVLNRQLAASLTACKLLLKIWVEL